MHGFAKFPLAPMDGLMRSVTTLLLPLPLILMAAGRMLPGPKPPPVQFLLGGAGAVMIAIYVLIWLAGRPSEFDVSPAGLKVKWPIREVVVPPTEITGARRLTKEQFRAEFGYGMRIGAGGLWGGFGFVKTAKATMHLYCSRTDEFVLVETKGLWWLITPEDPAKFVALIGEVKRG